MVDPIRRKLLKTGAAAAMAATPSVLAQQRGMEKADASTRKECPHPL